MYRLMFILGLVLMCGPMLFFIGDEIYLWVTTITWYDLVMAVGTLASLIAGASLIVLGLGGINREYMDRVREAREERNRRNDY